MDNETLKTLGDLWNNGVAFANTSGIMTWFTVIIYSVITYKLKKKDNVITIDVGKSNKKVDELKTEVKELKTTVNKLTDIIFIFANSTSIKAEAKKELAKIYSNTKTEIKAEIQETVEKVKEIATEVIEDIKETDIYEQIKNSI